MTPLPTGRPWYSVMARVWAVSAKTIRVLSRFSPTKTILGLSIITFWWYVPFNNKILKGTVGISGAFSIAAWILSPGFTTTSKAVRSAMGRRYISISPFSFAPLVARLIATLCFGSYLSAHALYMAKSSAGLLLYQLYPLRRSVPISSKWRRGSPSRSHTYGSQYFKS